MLKIRWTIQGITICVYEHVHNNIINYLGALINVRVMLYSCIRLNTLDALGSLPEPEETAQTMVVRQSQQAGRGTHKRRGSISQYIKRKLSKKKDNPGTATTTSYNFSSSSNVAPVSGSNRKARNSRVVSHLSIKIVSKIKSSIE